MSLGGGAIVRVDPQLIEERGIGKSLGQGGVPRIGMNGSQSSAQPRGDAGIGLASMSKAFQVTESSGAHVMANR